MLEDLPTLSVGWAFPDGSSYIDKLVVDGNEFKDTNMKIKDTGIKIGSIVELYSICFNDDDSCSGEEHWVNL